MADSYVGQIVLEINGAAYEVVSMEPMLRTGRVRVKTMNPTGKVRGTAKGIEEHELKVSVAIPKSGEPNWKAMIDAKISSYPQDGGGKRESWTGVHLVEMGSRYNVEGEATRDLTLGALNHYDE